ncbi:DUF2934 domain-containing protein [Azospirillum isscasi]|uniref:DUF2934 domain-containing protein n=1 Tax=Azospirillum isscasi TaxID=3053926 RepID=A0ABU0WHV2_9PROT|nr:DUF2934 domain-containing protein [Azospirillum isscasi]MDQ2103159.1 DUF2934 domain-containing protein [Azospirillum isscasi]
MQGDREDRIRHRAYEIWEREGRPEGRGESHWAQACAEIEAEDAASATGVVKTVVRRTKKAATELLGVGLNAVVDVVEEAIAPKKPRARRAKAEPAESAVVVPAPEAAKTAKPARAKAVKAEAAKPATPKPSAPRARRKPAVSDTEPAH